MVKYFKRGDRIHKYPVPDSCTVVYNNETLYDTPPAGDKCDNCFTELPR